MMKNLSRVTFQNHKHHLSGEVLEYRKSKKSKLCKRRSNRKIKRRMSHLITLKMMRNPVIISQMKKM